MLTEVDLADEFVHRIAHAVQRGWPEIVALIAPLLGESAACLDAPEASMEFGTAAMAVHLQASADGLVPDNAARIRRRILDRVFSTLGAVRRRAVEQYEHAWRDAMMAGRAPLDEVARLVCERWGLAHTDVRLRDPGTDPAVVVVLGTAILMWATPPSWIYGRRITGHCGSQW